MISTIETIISLVNSSRVFSDIHIEEGEEVMLKTPRGWAPVDGLCLDRDAISSLMESIDSNWVSHLESGRSINRPIKLEDWRLRVNAYLSFGSERVCMSIRRVPSRVPSLEELGLPPSLRMMLDSPRGLILVGGATGTGKTTTIAAMVEHINNTRNAHVITVEDPIEFLFQRKKSIFSQREVGIDVTSYFEGVRDAMRQRPDVVVIGEIRDKETAETALIAAESGHLVIASLHANTVVGSITKLLGFFPSSEFSSKVSTMQGALLGAIGQVLLPSANSERSTLVCEMLFNHKGQFSKEIGNKAALQSLFERAEDPLSRTFNQSLLELVKAGRITSVDALRAVVYNQSELYDQIQLLQR